MIGPALYEALSLFWLAGAMIFGEGRWRWVLLVGALMNHAAVLGNGGRMPVAGSAPGIIDMRHQGWESPMFPWLCDWMWDTMSPGDLVVFTSCVIWIIGTLSKKSKNNIKNPKS